MSVFESGMNEEVVECVIGQMNYVLGVVSMYGYVHKLVFVIRVVFMSHKIRKN